MYIKVNDRVTLINDRLSKLNDRVTLINDRLSKLYDRVTNVLWKQILPGPISPASASFHTAPMTAFWLCHPSYDYRSRCGKILTNFFYFLLQFLVGFWMTLFFFVIGLLWSAMFLLGDWMHFRLVNHCLTLFSLGWQLFSLWRWVSLLQWFVVHCSNGFIVLHLHVIIPSNLTLDESLLLGWQLQFRFNNSLQCNRIKRSCNCIKRSLTSFTYIFVVVYVLMQHFVRWSLRTIPSQYPRD